MVHFLDEVPRFQTDGTFSTTVAVVDEERLGLFSYSLPLNPDRLDTSILHGKCAINTTLTWNQQTDVEELLCSF